jgi:hypothetical protein
MFLSDELNCDFIISLHGKIEGSEHEQANISNFID